MVALQEIRPISILPREMLVTILSHSADLDSLLSSIASCRTLYIAFYCSPSMILKEIVLREIGIAILPEAIIALRILPMRHSRPRDSELNFAVSQQLEESKESLLSHRWNLADAIAAIRLHSIVEKFAVTFGGFYRSHLEALSQRQLEEPSREELKRVKRALYRFEIFCTFFPAGTRLPGQDFLRAQELFFFHFAAWEHEQLACIHESLWRQVTPAFNDIAQHDISWGVRNIRYVTRTDNLYTEAILSQGLRKLYAIAAAESYQRRYELLAYDMPVAAGEFLHDALVRRNHVRWRPRNSDGIEEHGAQASAIDADRDPGPERIWRWSHQGSRMGLVKRLEYRPMRCCGYVFWDAKRLDSIGLERGEWIDIEFEVEDDIALSEPTNIEGLRS